ncbi:MAG: prephenate dehydrogenase/arogenate dehydrogenase family protein, partial [Candidatus Omnitrophica bacterium]|nr:prephenate dehydrogenase/arogenate dehydrogenase family protein [Candidatus Omnitrophota bacterium]
MFKKVTIIGAGLIGGSIGLAARRKGLVKEVVGVCRHRKSLQKAKQKKAITEGSLVAKAAVKDADLVILAVPVSRIVQIVRQVAPYLKKGSLITDVGSTKDDVVRRIERLLPKGVYFIGAHPLAGSEKRGADSARADLFKNAICILTKTKKTNSVALNRIAKFWQHLGCRIKILNPQEHDRVVALVSHLPHLAATQLVKVAKGSLHFAARGFFDTTRIASSDAEIWSDICLSNKRFIVQAIDGYIKRMRFIRNLILKADKK